MRVWVKGEGFEDKVKVWARGGLEDQCIYGCSVRVAFSSPSTLNFPLVFTLYPRSITNSQMVHDHARDCCGPSNGCLPCARSWT